MRNYWEVAFVKTFLDNTQHVKTCSNKNWPWTWLLYCEQIISFCMKMFTKRLMPQNICTIWPSIWIVRNINYLLEHFSACIKIFITFCKKIHVKVLQLLSILIIEVFFKKLQKCLQSYSNVFFNNSLGGKKYLIKIEK